jgi:hypothetical protein
MSEVRAEAANAIRQAAQGWRREKPTNAVVDSTLTALIARLRVDIDPDVREALAETIGPRLPSRTLHRRREGRAARGSRRPE